MSSNNAGVCVRGAVSVPSGEAAAALRPAEHNLRFIQITQYLFDYCISDMCTFIVVYDCLMCLYTHNVPTIKLSKN